MSEGNVLLSIERAWERMRSRRSASRVPQDFRIEAYLAHGGPSGVVVRGRVFDGLPLTEAVDGESVWTAVRRTASGFLTHELPDVPLRVSVGDDSVQVRSDEDGYFLARLHPSAGHLEVPWAEGTVEVDGPYRGLTDVHATPVAVRVPSADARFGVISDVDDTILQTGVQRVASMVRTTFTGSSRTRLPFEGAASLYADLAAGDLNPFFYVSSSPWNLHAFVVGFLRHHGFPMGPVLLRDLLGTAAGREPKAGRLQEILDLHPDLRFVLVGDSGEKDPAVYAETIRANPGRIIAVYIREVRLDPADGRVEAVTDGWDQAAVPFVLVADSDAVRRHAAGLGLLG